MKGSDYYFIVKVNGVAGKDGRNYYRYAVSSNIDMSGTKAGSLVAACTCNLIELECAAIREAIQYLPDCAHVVIETINKDVHYLLSSDKIDSNCNKHCEDECVSISEIKILLDRFCWTLTLGKIDDVFYGDNYSSFERYCNFRKHVNENATYINDRKLLHNI